MGKKRIIIIGIIILSFFVSAYFYPQMPDRVASHWNTQGEVDGYMSKGWGLLKENINKFRKYFDGFIILLMLFLFYIYLLTILWNIGFRFDMGQLMIPALGILFYYCGILIENAKRNWFIGIRTPWTMSSETVWDKTHKIGGRLFKVAGVIAFFGIFFPKLSILFVMTPVLLVTLYTLIYSYFEYQKEMNTSSKL
ncbi:hypothetical protein AMJ48_03120 [Parcubacteria bacterium DG_74_1]|nr:MAG: hypothetical protein AMJ48_03120 [Parcubacteria bacterium DG_74_1]